MVYEFAKELTACQRQKISKLVACECANYDRKMCLLLDTACLIYNKIYATVPCKYFKKIILPFNPELESVLLEKPIANKKYCSICGSGFIPVGRQTYCSKRCETIGTRIKNRDRKQKQREKAAIECHDLAI